MPENGYLPRGGLKQAFQNFNRGGFAGAVRAKQPEALSALDFQVQSAHGFDFPVVGLAQVATLNGNGHMTSRRRVRAKDLETEMVIIQADQQGTMEPRTHSSGLRAEAHHPFADRERWTRIQRAQPTEPAPAQGQVRWRSNTKPAARTFAVLCGSSFSLRLTINVACRWTPSASNVFALLCEEPCRASDSARLFIGLQPRCLSPDGC